MWLMGLLFRAFTFFHLILKQTYVVNLFNAALIQIERKRVNEESDRS